MYKSEGNQKHLLWPFQGLLKKKKKIDGLDKKSANEFGVSVKHRFREISLFFDALFLLNSILFSVKLVCEFVIKKSIYFNNYAAELHKKCFSPFSDMK